MYKLFHLVLILNCEILLGCWIRIYPQTLYNSTNEPVLDHLETETFFSDGTHLRVTPWDTIYGCWKTNIDCDSLYVFPDKKNCTDYSFDKHIEINEDTLIIEMYGRGGRRKLQYKKL